MAITFSCQCGKEIKVADKFAGRRGKCPACGGAVTIPQPQGSDIDGDLLYEALGGQDDAEPVAEGECSACGKPMPGRAVFCTHCGYNRHTQTYIKSANADQANAKEPRAPLLSVAGIELGGWKVALIVAFIIAIPVWYYTGPARDLHLHDVQRVNVVEPILSGGTHAPLDEAAMFSSVSRGIKAPKTSHNPDPMQGEVHEVYSLGSSDRLIVTSPDPKGDHLVLEVALKQDTILNMKRTNRYDSIIAGKDFELAPLGGGTSHEGRLLYYQFDGSAEVDLGGANTSNYRTLFPTEPTQLQEEREYGSINGKATWYEQHIKGEITFYSSYAIGDFPAGKGLAANGTLKLTNHAGTKVSMNYTGDTLDIDWDPDASGWWSKSKYEQTSHFSPWHRYDLSLLFERPVAGGEFQLTYCGKPVATLWIDPTPAPKIPGVSPMKRTKSNGSHATTGININNPLAYFDILHEAREQARGIVSASNMRQIGLGLYMYLDQHGQVWPDRLDQLTKIMPGYRQVMVNPRTGEDPGFIYTRPEPGAAPATTPVLYESFQGKPDPNGAVLYADGHFQ